MSSHGGKRAGAGRPSMESQRVTVSIPAELLGRVEQLRAGRASRSRMFALALAWFKATALTCPLHEQTLLAIRVDENNKDRWSGHCPGCRKRLTVDLVPIDGGNDNE